VPVKGYENGDANEQVVVVKFSVPYTTDFGFGQIKIA
jgi:hypothetical protein